MKSIITSQKDRVTNNINEEELWAEQYSANSILTVVTFDTCRDGEWRLVFWAGIGAVFVFMFDATLRLFHSSPLYSFVSKVLR